MNDWRWLMVAVWLPALHVVATVTLSLWTRFVCHLLRAWSFDRHESITSKYMHATIKNCWNTSLNFVVTLAIATTRRKQYRLAKPSINRPRHCQSTPHNNDSNSYVRHRINRIFARAHRRNISFDLTDGRWSFGWLCRNRTHRHYKKKMKWQNMIWPTSSSSRHRHVNFWTDRTCCIEDTWAFMSMIYYFVVINYR